MMRTFSRIDSSTEPDCDEDICRVRRYDAAETNNGGGRFPNDEMDFRSSESMFGSGEKAVMRDG